jgi:hypothetical protein
MASSHHAEDRWRLSIVRSRDRLTEVRLRRVVGEGGTGTYVVERGPVDGCGTFEAALAAAWKRLASADREDVTVLADVLFVLLSTVPSAKRVAAPPPLAAQPLRIPRATAAHPRAFRGTKHKPPKEVQPALADLRPHLNATPNVRTLLADLWPARTRARARWQGLGGAPRTFARVVAAPAPPADVYAFVHHQQASPRGALAPAFVEEVLPCLSGAPWDAVRGAAALYDTLTFPSDAARGLAVRLLQLAPNDRGLSWWRALAAQPAERYSAFAGGVLAAEGWKTDAGHLPAEAWTDLGHRAPAEEYANWLRGLLRAIARGINPAYMAAGLRLAADYYPQYGFRHVEDAPDFDAATLALLEEITPRDWEGWDRLGLWGALGAVRGLSSALKRIPWSRLDEPRRRSLLRFFNGLQWYSDDGIDAATWKEIAPHLAGLVERLRDAPDAYVDQLTSDLGDVLETLRSPAKIRERLPLAVGLLARLNRPPFEEDGHLAWSIAHLLALPPEPRERVLAAPEGSFLRLDHACRRKNAGTLVAWGLSSLRTVTPELLADAFLVAPGTLFRTARELGVLSWAARATLLRRCAEGPLFAQGLAACAVAELEAALTAGGEDSLAILPRALREHLSGLRALSPAQVERHAAAVRRRLPEARLAAIRAAVADHLGRGLGLTRARRDLHEALALVQQAEKNRRGLRRFLRAYFAGDADYLRTHPGTLAWLQRHPRIDLEIWTKGFEHRFRTSDGEATIRLEDDALEVLKMGTYVDSCLGSGGGLSYSAAAAVLDINKQVLYARATDGRVLARQLLAITDDDRLAVFAVYPESVPAGLRRGFEEYDRTLARRLGIGAAARGEDYAIAQVLSYEWWDDGLAPYPAERRRSSSSR